MSRPWSGVALGVAIVSFALLFSGRAAAHGTEAEPAKDQWKLQFDLNEDGTRFVRIMTWHQIWVRAMELNPGSVVQGNDASWNFDVALRRSRIAIWAKPTERTTMYLHIGANNQSFNNPRKPQIFIHDIHAEYAIIPKIMEIGGGLHVFRGISRITSTSTISMMAMDAPIMNWPTIERTDQFARMFGIFLKGVVEGFGYRVSVNRPFTVDRPPSADSDYRPDTDTFAAEGYFEYMFWEEESYALPFRTGTYVGNGKRVLNVGAGFSYHPSSMMSCNDFDPNDPEICLDRDVHDQLALSADFFMENPYGNGNAFTAYLAYYYFDMGPNFLRHVGIINTATADPTATQSLNGPGNAYPAIGTGHHVYTQMGWVFPVGDTGVKMQPYLTTQASMFEARDDPAIHFGLGLNTFLHGHHAKITLHYQNRPIFELAPNGDSEASKRGSELILQLHTFI